MHVGFCFVVRVYSYSFFVHDFLQTFHFFFFFISLQKLDSNSKDSKSRILTLLVRASYLQTDICLLLLIGKSTIDIKLILD